MALNITGDLQSNSIELNNIFQEQSNGAIHLSGRDALVRIDTEHPCSYINANIGNKSIFIMRSKCSLPNLHVLANDGSVVQIGENSLSLGNVYLYSHESAKIIIGDDCLLGGGLHCLASDMHSIISCESGLRINPPGDITVSNHVWIGSECILLKGTHIGSGSIVGVRSTVMGAFPENCLILGYPARHVKSGVTWSADLKPMPTNE